MRLRFVIVSTNFNDDLNNSYMLPDRGSPEIPEKNDSLDKAGKFYLLSI